MTSEDKTYLKRPHRGSLFFCACFIVAFAMLSCGSGKEADQSQVEIAENTLFPLTAFEGEAQGTTYSIRYIDDSIVYKTAVDSILEAFDKDLSGWREGSLINRLNDFQRTDTVFAFVDSTKYFSVVFDVSREIWQKTDGAFDPTVFPLVELWGFGQKTPEEVSLEQVEETLKLVSMEPANIDMIEMFRDGYFYEETQIRKGQEQVKLDFNAIAQGYSIDLLGDYLQEQGVNDFMIELGGEVLCKGINQDGRAWRLAIDKPVDLSEQRQFQALLDVENKAVATSGSYRKFREIDGKKYSHAIDPRTGYPVTHNLLSATVLAKTCGEADAYATAFLVMGAERAMEWIDAHPEAGLEAYFIVDEEGSFKTIMSKSLEGKIIEL